MENRNEQQGVALHRGRELARWMALVASFLLVSLLVVTGSRAAFTDTTDNTGNQFAAGDVELVDDDVGSAMFAVGNMAPGDGSVNCIQVTYQGSIADPGAVNLYSGGYTDSGSLATFLNVTIEEGTGATYGDCSSFASEGTIYSGTLADFDTTHVDYASGVGTWDPSSTPESKSYRVTVTLDASADNTAQGQSVSDLAFVWEVST